MIPSSAPLPPVLPVEHLATLIGHPGLRVVDSRFDLDDAEYGAWCFEESRIPGSVFVALEERLSATVVPGCTGRHPLPSVSDLQAAISGLGIGPHTQVVVYDDFGGGFAARLWWILRWLGHDAVSVLDGGWPAWIRAGLPVEQGEATAVTPAAFEARPRPDLLAGAEEILARLGQPGLCLVDARSPERFRGEHEPRDPVAGTIPGARNAFWRDSLDAHDRFLAPAALRARFEAVLGEHASQDTIVFCGSGVTGAHDVLAMASAGLALPRLYAGSWSEWIADPARPVQRLVVAPGVAPGS
jgi:thiosulfate/3-mercaptopyruvate sulfurtransferase